MGAGGRLGASPRSASSSDPVTITATGGASGQPVTAYQVGVEGSPRACDVTGSGGTFTVTPTVVGTCSLSLRQAGDGDHTAATNVQVSFPVAGRVSTTAVAVNPTTLVATVSPHTTRPATVAAPTGAVDFYVAGTRVGTASLDADGTATLAHAVTAGQTQQVSAVYAGDARWAGSTGSTARRDPVITAAVSSSSPLSAAGWYAGPVTVTFTCQPGSAALAAACPAPVTLTSGVTGRVVTGTVTTLDGGAASVATAPINVDQGNPVGLRIRNKTGKRPTCVADDARSGIASCTVTRQVRGTGTQRRVILTATAVDNAGNTKTRRVVLRGTRH